MRVLLGFVGFIIIIRFLSLLDIFFISVSMDLLSYSLSTLAEK